MTTNNDLPLLSSKNVIRKDIKIISNLDTTPSHDYNITQNHQESQEYRRSVNYQIIFSIAANLSILSSGMVLGFPAIALHSLQNHSNKASLYDEEASWFGMITKIMLHKILIK